MVAVTAITSSRILVHHQLAEILNVVTCAGQTAAIPRVTYREISIINLTELLASLKLVAAHSYPLYKKERFPLSPEGLVGSLGTNQSVYKRYKILARKKARRQGRRAIHSSLKLSS